MTDEKGGALVVHCSDGRFQAHFQEFLREKLGVEHYALIAVPGGAQFLTMDAPPRFSGVGWTWEKFMIDLLHPERIILIAHEDCRWYRDRPSGAAGLREREIADLHVVRAALAERFDCDGVELYYARLENGECLFEPV